MKKKVLTIALIVFLMAVAFIFVMAIYLISPLPTLVSIQSKKHIAGNVYDCTTGAVISDAAISVSGIGWGYLDGTLVWDKYYTANTTSDGSGDYTLFYPLGTEVVATKEGYLMAHDVASSGKTVRIGLLSKENMDPEELTFQCKLSSECKKEGIRNGGPITWDACMNPDYKP